MNHPKHWISIKTKIKVMKKWLKKTPRNRKIGEIHSTFKNNGQTMDNGNFCEKQKPTNADI